MESFQYIPLARARELVLDQLKMNCGKTETVDLADALGRVTAENLLAEEDLPPFSRSTVDGFAVRSADTFGAGEAVPVLLTVVGEVAMGEVAGEPLSAGEAVGMPTGGMLPAGADAVVMVELTEQLDSLSLLVLKVMAPGENVVSRGEDIMTGSVVVPAGQRIGPQHIAALAACGFDRVPVCRRPVVSVISSGDELVDIGDKCGPGQIRDVNSYTLAAMLIESGCIVRRKGIVKDSFEEFTAVLREAVANSQLVVISGGSSVGARDFTVKAINALGQPGVLIHGVAAKPGRPTIFGLVGDVPVFGLPGHPVAAMLICRQLVNPAVRLLSGLNATCGLLRVPAVLSRNVASAPGRDDFVTVRLSKHGGQFVAEPILGKSGLVHIMAQAGGILHIPAEKSGLYTGEMVEIILLNPCE